jgi:type VI secretion system secreted protein VgrG
MARHTQLTTPLGRDAYGDPVLAFRQLEGRDALNSLFHYHLTTQSLRRDIDPHALIGETVTVGFDDQFGQTNYLNAMVTQMAWVGSDEQHQLYRLTLAPALHMADLRSDCRIFQDKSVPEIVDQVLQYYSILPKHQLSGRYPRRDFCVQYNETDFAFISRLLEEEGISYYFRHTETRHTLVLDDFMHVAGPVARHSSIPFRTSSNADQGKQEALFEWHNQDSMVSGRFTHSDYWYKTPSQPLLKSQIERKERDSDQLERFEWPGNYYQGEQGERLAQIRLEQQQQSQQSMQAKSNVRAFAFGVSGNRFELTDHPHTPMNRGYTILASHLFLQENPGTTGQTQRQSSAPEWRITLDFQSAKLPLRPLRKTPRPNISGLQHAKVVGKAGQEVWTNEYGQVKLHFGWDRYSKQDETSSIWIRVASSWAGSNWGEVMIPRIGQEVMVAFFDGDPDYPMVVGRVNNAEQMPTTFSHRGNLPGNLAIAGIKSKELFGNRYNQLLFDDTSGQIRTQLESEHGKTQLNLGYLTEPREGAQAASRGEGFELRTDSWGVMRAQKGIMISSASQHGGTGNAMARQELTTEIDQALEQAQAQADYAKSHQAMPSDQAPQKALAQAVKEWGVGSNVENGAGSGGKPIVAVSSPGGIAMASGTSSTIAANAHLDLVAGKNQHLSAGATLHLHAGMGISQFAQSGGIKTIAHQGKHIIQAQQDDIQIAADQSVSITASHNHVLVAADKHITLMCGGAYIKIAGGNIEIHAPGKIDMKAAHYDMFGPTSSSAMLPKFDKGDTGRKFKLLFTNSTQAIANRAYTISMKDGKTITGKTDAKGLTDLLDHETPNIANIEIKPAHV